MDIQLQIFIALVEDFKEQVELFRLQIKNYKENHDSI